MLDRVAIAALLCVLASASLLLGAAIGIYGRPSRRMTAVVMAFGSGALIQALSVNLALEGAERLLHEAHLGPYAAWAFVAGGFAAGGLAFYLADRAIQHRGGALRSAATTDAYLLERKRAEAAGLMERLARVELLRYLPPEEMEGLLLCARPLRLEAGTVVFQRGDPGDGLYLIEEGRFAVLANGLPRAANASSSGRLATAPGKIDLGQLRQAERLNTLGPGAAFGEVALVSGEPRTATIVADEDAELLLIPKEDFDRLVARSPALRQAVHALSMQRVLNTVRVGPAEEAERWHRLAVDGVQRLSAAERAAYLEKEGNGHGVPLAIFLGSLLDGIPECIVIGAGFRSLATFNPTFLLAVFLADFAEAMGSAAGMRQAGFTPRRILTMWGGAVVASALAGALGNAFLLAAPATVITFVEALAGGAILGMIAATMMPVAFREGGPSVGLATIAGFLSTFLITTVKIA